MAFLGEAQVAAETLASGKVHVMFVESPRGFSDEYASLELQEAPPWNVDGSSAFSEAFARVRTSTVQAETSATVRTSTPRGDSPAFELASLPDSILRRFRCSIFCTSKRLDSTSICSSSCEVSALLLEPLKEDASACSLPRAIGATDIRALFRLMTCCTCKRFASTSICSNSSELSPLFLDPHCELEPKLSRLSTSQTCLGDVLGGGLPDCLGAGAVAGRRKLAILALLVSGIYPSANYTPVEPST